MMNAMIASRLRWHTALVFLLLLVRAYPFGWGSLRAPLRVRVLGRPNPLHCSKLHSNESESERESDGSQSDSSQMDVNEQQRLQIERQQIQIQQLVDLMQHSKGEVPREPYPAPGLSSQSSQSSQSQRTLAPLKVMLFIDGTWLYYSLYHRQSSSRTNPLSDKFGEGWVHSHHVLWEKLPGIIARAISEQEGKLAWGTTESRRDVDIVRANVYTGYRQGTDSNSLRVKMFDSMSENNYDVFLSSTNGLSEKCIDIQLAVEMLHYATEPGAYDVAVILTGDRDFEPAMFRTRQKGKKVALVSMRAGCNKSLQSNTGNIRDYDIIWLDDKENLDQLVVMKDGGGSVVNAITAVVAIAKFVLEHKDGGAKSRSVGRFLKMCKVDQGEGMSAGTAPEYSTSKKLTVLLAQPPR